MGVNIERVEIGGEPRRRFYLLVEVTFRSRGEDDYYADDELVGMATGWMLRAVEDRDDSPAARFLALPGVIDVDAAAVAKGDYPNHTHQEW